MGRKPNYIITMDALYGSEGLSDMWDHPAKYIGKYNRRTGKMKPLPDIQNPQMVDVIGSKRSLQRINREEAESMGVSVREMPRIRQIKPTRGKKNGK